jgi:hypothetical protein
VSDLLQPKKPPYYWVDKWGNGYWSPKKHMREAGFDNVACGADGPEAQAKAWTWVKRWKDHKAGITTGKPREVWPAGSLGEAFERFRRTAEWSRKEPRTREDWDRGWKLIKSAFAAYDPKTVTLEAMSLWYAGDPDDPTIKGLLGSVGVREGHRAVKIWRALWTVAAALKYCKADEDPSFGIRRKTPKARNARWREGETVRLAKRAWRSGFHGAACAIAIAWDTQFSPVDVRKLSGRHLKNSGGRLIFDRTEEGREKSDVAVIGTLSRRTERLVRAYLKMTFGDADIHPSAILFRNRSGAPYSKDTLGDDFRDIRAAEFGPVTKVDGKKVGEMRQLQDMRRSAAIEATAGGADPAAMANKMGNSIDENRELQTTYVPSSEAIIRTVDNARLIGRRRIREDR